MNGFLPATAPAKSLKYYPTSLLDDIGRNLPSLVEDKHFRTYVRGLSIPPWPVDHSFYNVSHLRLYYVRLGFLASAYINQVGFPRETLLPHNIAVPFVKACNLLNRPPILSYDGYALYNWKRFSENKPVALGNIDTLQNFVHLYDEHWFILVHVEIEAIGAIILREISNIKCAPEDATIVNVALRNIASAVWEQVAVLKRIPEKMDPALYFKTFRQYIRFFENVVYERVNKRPLNFRGETGAQSSLLPALVALMKIDHRQSALTDHLAEMQQFMPAEHRSILQEIRAMRDIRSLAEKELYNDVLEAMAVFREVHYGWAVEYIQKWTDDPRGTGGTPYMEWLKQLIDETRQHKVK